MCNVIGFTQPGFEPHDLPHCKPSNTLLPGGGEDDDDDDEEYQMPCGKTQNSPQTAPMQQAKLFQAMEFKVAQFADFEFLTCVRFFCFVNLDKYMMSIIITHLTLVECIFYFDLAGWTNELSVCLWLWEIG